MPLSKLHQGSVYRGMHIQPTPGAKSIQFPWSLKCLPSEAEAELEASPRHLRGIRPAGPAGPSSEHRHHRRSTAPRASSRGACRCWVKFDRLWSFKKHRHSKSLVSICSHCHQSFLGPHIDCFIRPHENAPLSSPFQGTLVIKGSRSRYHGQNNRITLLNQVSLLNAFVFGPFLTASAVPRRESVYQSVWHRLEPRRISQGSPISPKQVSDTNGLSRISVRGGILPRATVPPRLPPA